uniref:Protein quiver n=1 Tax=Parascaris univalens TaxID=6257 RepID=A0A915AMH5_PARUN
MATLIYSLFTTPISLTCQLFILMAIEGVASIGCFVCSSFNGSNPLCEDTFNSTINQGTLLTLSGTYYQYPCWAFKKQRQGLFPADHCIKVNGYRSDQPAQTMVIRTCALDSGTLTADTEIVRISHCGHFKYEGYQYSGCVQACDTDGCNIATTHNSHYCLTFILPAIVSLLHYSSTEEFLLICNNFLSTFMQQLKTTIYLRRFSILRRFFSPSFSI